jgi:hypothetical protein
MQHMNRNLRSTVAVAALLLGASTLAQAQSTSGNITGMAVAGETVVIHGANTGFHRELKIDKDGKYSVRRVPTGSYVITKTGADGSVSPPQSVEIHAGVTVRAQ